MAPLDLFTLLSGCFPFTPYLLQSSPQDLFKPYRPITRYGRVTILIPSDNAISEELTRYGVTENHLPESALLGIMYWYALLSSSQTIYFSNRSRVLYVAEPCEWCYEPALRSTSSGSNVRSRKVRERSVGLVATQRGALDQTKVVSQAPGQALNDMDG